MSDSLRPHGLQPIRLLCPWDSPGKLPCSRQRIFPTQGLNLQLLNVSYIRRWVLYHQCHLVWCLKDFKLWYINFREAVSGYTDGNASSNEVIFLRSSVMSSLWKYALKQPLQMVLLPTTENLCPLELIQLFLFLGVGDSECKKDHIYISQYLLMT